MSLPPAEVLARYAGFEAAAARPYGRGLINDTFLLEAPSGRCVLQRLHPVFGAAVHHDIEAVTAHLARKGMVTPRLIPTRDGALWVERPTPERTEVWRAQTFLPDLVTYDRLARDDHAAAAGALVGRFHSALRDLDHEYRFVRAGVHDTHGHLATLAAAVEASPGHRLYEEVAPLAEMILAAGRSLPDLTGLPRRHSHGDLKLSNLLFDARREGVCLVDLDTVGRMNLAFELGDALRSWCNPSGEDATDCAISAERVGLAVAGYASAARDLVDPAEAESLVDGLATICVELAARFAADALLERYFGWDPSRHPSRGAHNLVRARGQWSLARSVLADRAGLQARVAAAMSA
ncbi:MAG: phosphotransferase [Deltaproteobacteria bacterium]|nr:phosphotransferase [Myxococcales bacterium]MDP3221397.1 phosphotransferase [Deltaproteobacteria bacterium]